MRGLIVEQNSFGANPGTKDLARHLYTRMNCGKVVIVADKPNSLISALRKQWLKLARKVQKEAASTLNVTRIYELNEIITRMRTLRFTTKWPPDSYEPVDVHIATIDELLRWAPEAECRTLYVACALKPEHLHIVTAWIREGGVIVMCRLPNQANSR